MADADVTIGIHNEKIDTLSMEILRYADEVIQILNATDACITQLPSFYHGAACDEIMHKYHDLSQSFSTIKNNIVSYSEDLVALKNKVYENSEHVSSLMEDAASETLTKAHSVEQSS